MTAGTVRRMRGTAMRPGHQSWMRDPRQRHSPTNHGHAALPPATREYQSDSSSKRPAPSSVFPELRPLIRGPTLIETTESRLTKVVPYQL